MKHFFKVNTGSIEVISVEVHKETERYIYLKGGRLGCGVELTRVSKVGNTWRYFPSHEEAKNHLIERETKKLKYLQAQLEEVEGNLKALGLPF